MTHRIFGQQDARATRNRQFQSWLNCAEVRSGGQIIAPVCEQPDDVAKIVQDIRNVLQLSEHTRAQANVPATLADLVLAELTPAERARTDILRSYPSKY
jgi:hypothetical protein